MNNCIAKSMGQDLLIYLIIIHMNKKIPDLMKPELLTAVLL
jgi:hypothetical protein